MSLPTVKSLPKQPAARHTFADIDLDAGYETWYSGEQKERYPTLKDCYLGMRRPDTYHELLEQQPDRPAWQTAPDLAHAARDS